MAGLYQFEYFYMENLFFFPDFFHFSMNWNLLWILILSTVAVAYAAEGENEGNSTDIESSRNGKSNKTKSIMQLYFSEMDYLIVKFRHNKDLMCLGFSQKKKNSRHRKLC